VSVGVAVSAAAIAMAVAPALALALVVGVPVALTIALAFGLALAVALTIARAFALTVAVAVGLALSVGVVLAVAMTFVPLERASLSRALVTTSVALLLALLLTVGVVSLSMLLRGLLALLRGQALLRTGPDCVAVAQVCRQRSLRDVDRHERVLLRVSVVTDRHLGRWVLSGRGGDARTSHEPRGIADPTYGRERRNRESDCSCGGETSASGFPESIHTRPPSRGLFLVFGK
jgi:hypothetical protein